MPRKKSPLPKPYMKTLMNLISSILITAALLHVHKPGSPLPVLLGLGILAFIIAEIAIGFFLAMIGE